MSKAVLPVDILKHLSLSARNTFGLPAVAEYFCECRTEDDLLEGLEFARTEQLPITVLGGGSNLVLKDAVPGLVLAINTKGISASGDQVRFAAGENWHQSVCWAIEQGRYGLENLSLIPGNVGAAPIQNIGAYGVEISERLVSVDAVSRASGERVSFSNADCKFGYRDSVFKQSARDQFVIVTLTVKLDPVFTPNLAYQGITNYLYEHQLDMTAAHVSDAVIALRREKLPDYRQQGNAGSFFKNPLVSEGRYRDLCRDYPDLTGHIQDDGQVKLSAAQLIDQLGLKGHKVGGAMVSKQHALVIVNTGSASFDDVSNLAEFIQGRVSEAFDLRLEIEPVMIN